MPLPNLRQNLLGYLWLAFLGLALGLSALSAYQRAMQVAEYALGCDSFGYLQMAQEVRQAWAGRRGPDFSLETPRTRQLIDFMRAQQVPEAEWQYVVGPHAYHYFPRTGRIGAQYPPGTAYLLAWFPPGQALHALDRIVVVVFLLVGLAVLAWSAVRRAWAVAGLMILALHLGYEILGRIAGDSYSINAVLVPLLLGTLFFFQAIVWRARRRSLWAVACFGVAGLWLGLAIMIRLPVALLLPGMVLLLWHESWRASLIPALVFGAGVGISGVLPVLANQQRVAGAWYLPTYGANDSAAPTLRVLADNFDFYLTSGAGSSDNWALWLMVLGIAGLWLIHLVWPRALPGLSWRRLVTSVLVLWGVPTAYFLTHPIAIHYYAIPAAWGAVLFLACGAWVRETCGQPVKTPVRENSKLLWLGLLLAFTPGLAVLRQAYLLRPPAMAVTETPPRFVSVPDELTDARAWVWAGETSGTLWYYAGVPGYKMFWAAPSIRTLIYGFAQARGEPQYIVKDSPAMQPLLDEIKTWGGTLEARGEVDSYPYYLIHWQPGGPHE